MRRATADDIRDILDDKDVFMRVLPPEMWEMQISVDIHRGWEAYGDSRGVILADLRAIPACEWHWLMTDALSGSDKLQLAKQVLCHLFTERGVKIIHGATPRDNMAARVMNRAVGARPTGESTDAQGRRCIDYVLEKESWAT